MEQIIKNCFHFFHNPCTEFVFVASYKILIDQLTMVKSQDSDPVTQ